MPVSTGFEAGVASAVVREHDIMLLLHKTFCSYVFFLSLALVASAVMAQIPRRNVFVFSSSNGAEVAGEFDSCSFSTPSIYIINHARLLSAWGRVNLNVHQLD